MASTDPQKLRLGGMALRNGLLIHGPTHWAAAVRDRDGGIQVASERKPELAPGLAARMPGLLRRRARSTALREVVIQTIGAVPAAVALLDRDLAAYHGAEHKAIAAYEQGVVEEVASVPKEHDRCGSNLMVPMMLLSAGGTVLLERLVDDPSQLARAAVALGGASLAVEMFVWSDRNHGAPLAEAFHTPGREIQRHLATREPTPEQLEVSLAALTEILRVEPPPAPAA